jgi:hypothetical protein
MQPTSHSHGATSRADNSATATGMLASDIRSRGRRDSRLESSPSLRRQGARMWHVGS